MKKRLKKNTSNMSAVYKVTAYINESCGGAIINAKCNLLNCTI